MHGPRTVVSVGDRLSGPSFAGRPAVEKIRLARPSSLDRPVVASLSLSAGLRDMDPAATAGAPLPAGGAAPVLSGGSATAAALVLTEAFAVTGTAGASVSLHDGGDASDLPDLSDAAGTADALGGTVATGFDRLDAELPGGGWPCRALTELLLPPAGASELRLLAPVLRTVLRAGRTVMLFDPPVGLTARSLARLGLDAEDLLVVESRNRLLADAGSLWALEQALKSGHVGAVVAWLPPRLAAERLRRLQLAAQRHDGPAFVLREAAAAARPTAAPLRLALHPHRDDGLTLRLLKRRLPASAGLLRLALPPLQAVPAVTSTPSVAGSADAIGATTVSMADGSPCRPTAMAGVLSQASLFAPCRLPVPAADGDCSTLAEAPSASTAGPYAEPEVDGETPAASRRSSRSARPADRPLRSAVFVDLAA